MIQSVRHFRQPLPVATPVRVIGYYCEGICGGWADRQKGIVTAFVLAAMLGKQFKIHMPQPCELGFFLSPRGDVNWRLDPGELVGRQVQWIDRLDSTAVSFLQVCSTKRPLLIIIIIMMMMIIIIIIVIIIIIGFVKCPFPKEGGSRLFTMTDNKYEGENSQQSAQKYVGVS